MHKILGNECYATLRPAATMAKPTPMNAVSKLGRVPLGAGCVHTLGARVLMRMIAEELHPLERLAIAAQGPGLPQSGARCPCGMADEAVHAAIETIRDTAPLEEACLDIPSPPIHARTGPF